MVKISVLKNGVLTQPVVLNLTHLRLQTVHLPPAEEWTIEYPRWCVFRIAEGDAFWMGSKEQRALSPGDMGVVLPFRRGIIRSSRLNQVRVVCFFFAPAFLNDLLSVEEAHFFQRCEAVPERAVCFLTREHPAARQFADACEAKTLNNLALHGQMLATVGHMFAADLAVAPPVGTEGLFCRKRVLSLLKDISAAEFLNLKLEHLAGRCGCADKRFARFFRGTVGRQVKTLNMEFRLFRARELLVDSQCTIDSIAREAGYESIGAFNNSFKKQFGMRPAEWRQTAAGLEGHS